MAESGTLSMEECIDNLLEVIESTPWDHETNYCDSLSGSDSLEESSEQGSHKSSDKLLSQPKPQNRLILNTNHSNNNKNSKNSTKTATNNNNNNSKNNNNNNNSNNNSNNIGEEEDIQLLRKKRKQEYCREYYRRSHPFSPVFKNDVRRQLARMWVNVINWNDPLLLKSFFDHFSTRDCVHVNYLPAIYSMMFPTIKEVAGNDQTILHSAYTFITTPDCTCRVIQCRLVQSKDAPGTTINFSVRFRGTRIYDLVVPSLDSIPELRSSATSTSQVSTIPQKEDNALFPNRPQVSLAYLKSLRFPLASPIGMEVDGEFVFKLDAQQSMYAYEFHWERVISNITMPPAPI
eukprot:gene9646-10665_t